MNARTWRGDGVAGWKYPSLLEDFQTGTASMARKRHLASSARGFCCFCLMTHRTHPFNRLIRGRKSQLIQNVANEAEGLFRYFKRSPKEYSAWWASRPIWNKNNYSADSFHPSHSFRSPYVISYIIIRGRCLCCVLQAEEWLLFFLPRIERIGRICLLNSWTVWTLEPLARSKTKTK